MGCGASSATSTSDRKYKAKEAAAQITGEVGEDDDDFVIEKSRKVTYRQRRMLEDFKLKTGISQEEMEAIFVKFRAADRLADKELSLKEFCRLFNVKEPTPFIKAFFKSFDEDGSGKLDFKEVLVGLHGLCSTDIVSEAAFCFKVYDKDATGYISQDELVQVIRASSQISQEMAEKKAARILRRLDKDGDGQLSAQEFKDIAKQYPDLLFPGISLRKEWMEAVEVAKKENAQDKADGKLFDEAAMVRTFDAQAVFNEQQEEKVRKKIAMERGHGVASSMDPGAQHLALSKDDEMALIDERRLQRLLKQSHMRRQAALRQLQALCDFEVKDIEKLLEYFQKSDKNGNGTVSLAEFKEGMAKNTLRSLDGGARERAEKVLTDIYGMLDLDKDNEVSFREFVVGMLSFSAADPESKLRTAFRSLDQDNSGVLEAKELAQLVAQFNQNSDSNAVSKKVTAILRRMDRDATDTIDLDEFIQLCIRQPELIFPEMAL